MSPAKNRDEDGARLQCVGGLSVGDLSEPKIKAEDRPPILHRSSTDPGEGGAIAGPLYPDVTGATIGESQLFYFIALLCESSLVDAGEGIVRFLNQRM